MCARNAVQCTTRSESLHFARQFNNKIQENERKGAIQSAEEKKECGKRRVLLSIGIPTERRMWSRCYCSTRFSPSLRAMMRVAAVVALVGSLFSSNSCTFLAVAEKPSAWNPYIALRPQQLIALYPFTNDFHDYAPSGSKSDGYGQHGTGRRVEVPAALGNGGVVVQEGTRFDRTSGVDLPIHIHPSIFPRLTMGAWVYIESILTQSAYEMDPCQLAWLCWRVPCAHFAVACIFCVLCRCVISEDGSGSGRSLCMETGKWTASGQLQPEAAVKTGVWMFVAVVYDDVALSVDVFVDGVMVSLDSSLLSNSGSMFDGSAVVGSAANANNGFAGSIRNVFFYGEALSEHELRYLMTSKMKALPLAVGHWGYAFEQSDDSAQSYLAIPASRVGDSLASGSLLMWVAPNGPREQPFCICQFASLSETRSLTIWATYDQRAAASFLRVVDLAGANDEASEYLYPGAVLSTAGEWQRFGVTWGNSFVHVYINENLEASIHDICVCVYFDGLVSVRCLCCATSCALRLLLILRSQTLRETWI